MKELTITEGAATFPPEASGYEIPRAAVALYLGAIVHLGYKGKKDAVGLEWSGKVRIVLTTDAMEEASQISKHLSSGLSAGRVSSSWEVLSAYDLAIKEYRKHRDNRAGRRGIAMLKDRGGCGYWRMILPSKHLNLDGLYVDVTAAAVHLDYLLEYDTIFVQRLHDWDSFYTLERLKAAGKRIVYDIDDDIFSIEPSNPAAQWIGRDEQVAAVECMKLADVVTVTTPYLRDRISELIGKTPEVIRNALEVEGWADITQIGSPDGIQRIFWSGSATHSDDWMECIEAVDGVMKERSNVHMVILGYLPPAVQGHLAESHWKGKVEYLGFNSPETYFEIVKHVRAECGLAPITSCAFNQAKSEIKWVEYSMMGFPTIASDSLPYSEVIGDGENGYLCSTVEDWGQAIRNCLDNKGRNEVLVWKSREQVKKDNNIVLTAQSWRKVLIGS